MVVYIEGNDIHSTLTTWFYTGYWQAYAALQQGHTPYFNWPIGKSVLSYEDKEMFARVPNMYDWYFVQPYFETKPQADEVRTWNTDANTGLYPFMSEPLHVIKSFYKKHLIFNPTVNEIGNKLVDKYNIDFSKTIGITWRGTDIYLDGRPRMPIETYFPFIDDILEKNPDYRILCTAEETQILDPLLKRYPNAFTMDEFYSSPHGSKHNPERFSPFTGFARGLQPALMVWIFSKCAHYIKNRSSTGAVASWLSSGKIYCLAHPENLGHENKLDMAEIEGKLYPLNR